MGDPGQPTTFAANALGGTAPYTYAWDIDGTVAAGQVVSHTFVVSGTHPVVLTVTDSAASAPGVAMARKSIMVDDCPPQPPEPPPTGSVGSVGSLFAALAGGASMALVWLRKKRSR